MSFHKHFLNFSWFIQLSVGICLFFVSFLIEKEVLSAFISSSSLAFLLAASLEIGKAVAIIWHRYMCYQSSLVYPTSVKFASNSFRLGLFALSMLCSLLFLANNLDRPNLEQVRNAEITRTEARLKESLQRMEQLKQERLDVLEASQKSEYLRIKNGFDKHIEALESDLKKEMSNVVNGTFKGPRYAEIQSRLEQEKQQQNKSLKALLATHKQSYIAQRNEIQDVIETKREGVYTKADTNREALINNDFANDDRANDPRIVSFLKVLDSVFHLSVLPLQFVFVFSLLISLLMEIGILLAFNTITLSILPSLKAKHEADLSEDLLNTEVEQEAKKDEIRHKEAINKIRNTADNVMDKAQEYMNVHKHN